MAVYRMIIRKASPSVVPLTAIGSFSTILNGAIFDSRGALNQSHSFSSVANDKDTVDTNLREILEREIKSAKSKINNFKVLPNSYSLPFEIKINVNRMELNLTRKFPDDEEVSITIKMSDVNTKDIDTDYNIHCDHDSTEDDDTATDESKKRKSYKNDYKISEQDGKASAIPIPMVIEVQKGGYVKSLEFNVTMSTDGINIEKYFISNDENDYEVRSLTGPQLEGSLYKLQPFIHKYLEIRGIDNNMASFLLEYIAKKKKEIELRILNDLKEAIEK